MPYSMYHRLAFWRSSLDRSILACSVRHSRALRSKTKPHHAPIKTILVHRVQTPLDTLVIAGEACNRFIVVSTLVYAFEHTCAMFVCLTYIDLS
jgi:hypothetical protein